MAKPPTNGELLALKAVAEGKIVKIYRRNGNVFNRDSVCPPIVLRRIEKNGWIRDGKSTGGIEIHTTMVLTKIGELTLDGASN